MRKETILTTTVPALPDELLRCAIVAPSHLQIWLSGRIMKKLRAKVTGALTFTAFVAGFMYGWAGLTTLHLLVPALVCMWYEAGNAKRYQRSLRRINGGDIPPSQQRSFLERHLGELRLLLREREDQAARLAVFDHHTRKDRHDTLVADQSIRTRTQRLLESYRSLAQAS